jgi:hypothetical protein
MSSNFEDISAKGPRNFIDFNLRSQKSFRVLLIDLRTVDFGCAGMIPSGADVWIEYCEAL